MRRLNAYAWNLLVRVLFYVRCATSTAPSSCSTAVCSTTIDIESVGAMVNTELMVKLGRKGASVVEVGVHPPAAQPGEARGASPQVIPTAFREVLRMRKRLAALDGHEF